MAKQKETIKELSDEEKALAAEEKEKEDAAKLKEWFFQDLEGSRIRVAPWPLAKSRRLMPLVGKKLKEVKALMPEGSEFSLELLLTTQMDIFLEHCFDFLCFLIVETCNKDDKWLEFLDNAMALEVFDVIVAQNFTGARMWAEIYKFYVPKTVLEWALQQQLQNEKNQQESQ